MIYIREPKHKTFIAEGFQNVLENDSFSDVVFVCEDNIKVKAHKAVLASHSKFLKGLIEDTVNDGPIILPKVKESALNSLLVLLYSGSVSVTKESYSDIQCLLKEFCINHAHIPKEDQSVHSNVINISRITLRKKDVSKKIAFRVIDFLQEEVYTGGVKTGVNNTFSRTENELENAIIIGNQNVAGSATFSKASSAKYVSSRVQCDEFSTSEGITHLALEDENEPSLQKQVSPLAAKNNEVICSASDSEVTDLETVSQIHTKESVQADIYTGASLTGVKTGVNNTFSRTENELENAIIIGNQNVAGSATFSKASSAKYVSSRVQCDEFSTSEGITHLALEDENEPSLQKQVSPLAAKNNEVICSASDSEVTDLETVSQIHTKESVQADIYTGASLTDSKETSLKSTSVDVSSDNHTSVKKKLNTASDSGTGITKNVGAETNDISVAMREKVEAVDSATTITTEKKNAICKNCVLRDMKTKRYVNNAECSDRDNGNILLKNKCNNAKVGNSVSCEIEKNGNNNNCNIDKECSSKVTTNFAKDKINLVKQPPKINIPRQVMKRVYEKVDMEINTDSSYFSIHHSPSTCNHKKVHSKKMAQKMSSAGSEKESTRNNSGAKDISSTNVKESGNTVSAENNRAEQLTSVVNESSINAVECNIATTACDTPSTSTCFVTSNTGMLNVRVTDSGHGKENEEADSCQKKTENEVENTSFAEKGLKKVMVSPTVQHATATNDKKFNKL